MIVISKERTRIFIPDARIWRYIFRTHNITTATTIYHSRKEGFIGGHNPQEMLKRILDENTQIS